MRWVHFIGTAISTWSIRCTCFRRNSTLVRVSLRAKSICTVTRCCWLDWRSIAHCVYLWFKKRTFRMLVNSGGSGCPVPCNCWIGIGGSAPRWNYHIMHQLLLLARGSSLSALSCSMLFTVFVKIERLSKGCRVHVVSCLWINNTLLRTVLSHD